jgi:tripeptide aminopeptidase
MSTAESVVKRFLRYISIDTQSDPRSTRVPSTRGQERLAELLYSELVACGASDVRIDSHSCVYATIPATTRRADGTELPTLGFIAHMDTSPACSGRDIRPQVFRDYQGGPLALNVEQDIILSPRTHPELLDCIGGDIIASDGTTLLGADDKAGIAEIMCMAETLLNDPSIAHPRIRIAFTVDEEIGHSFENFDVRGFNADYAYTVDGTGYWGKIEYENFNAATAIVDFTGVNAHPGSAKGVMRNASIIAMKYFNALPFNERPELTDGYRGFFMLESLQGNVEHAQARYLIRDHSRRKFEAKKQLMYSAARALNERYGDGTVSCTITDSYYNMRERIDPENMHLVNNAKEAVRLCAGSPEEAPIRGGTDGAYLSYAGIPCPNLSCGANAPHSKFEFIDHNAMTHVVMLLVSIAGIYGAEGNGLTAPPDEEAENTAETEAITAAMESLDRSVTGSFKPVKLDEDGNVISPETNDLPEDGEEGEADDEIDDEDGDEVDDEIEDEDDEVDDEEVDGDIEDEDDEVDDEEEPATDEFEDDLDEEFEDDDEYLDDTDTEEDEAFDDDEESDYSDDEFEDDEDIDEDDEVETADDYDEEDEFVDDSEGEGDEVGDLDEDDATRADRRSDTSTMEP